MVRLDPGDIGEIDGVYVSLTLPDTGTDPGPWVVGGVMVLGVGLALRRLVRRRPTMA